VLDESCLVIVQVTLPCSRLTSNGRIDFRDLADRIGRSPLAMLNYVSLRKIFFQNWSENDRS
jgi:hypothetical protein